MTVEQQKLAESYEKQLLAANIGPKVAKWAAQDLAAGKSTKMVKEAYRLLTGQ